MKNSLFYSFLFIVSLSFILLSGCRTKILEIENDAYQVQGYLSLGPITTSDAVSLNLKSKSSRSPCSGQIFFSDENDSLYGYFLNEDIFILENGFHWFQKIPKDYHIFNFLKSDCKNIEYSDRYIILDPDTIAYHEFRASPLEMTPKLASGKDSLRVTFCKTSIREDMFLIRTQSEVNSSFLHRRVFVPYAQSVYGRLIDGNIIQLDIVWTDGEVAEPILITLPKTKLGGLKFNLVQRE